MNSSNRQITEHGYYRLAAAGAFFLSLAALGSDDMDTLVSGAIKNLDQQTLQVETDTAKMLQERGPEIEKKRKADREFAQQAHALVEKTIEEEAQIDRTPPVDGKTPWETIPDGFVTYVDNFYQKNGYRVDSITACSGPLPESIAWIEDDRALIESKIEGARSAAARSQDNLTSARTVTSVKIYASTYDEMMGRSNYASQCGKLFLPNLLGWGRQIESTRNCAARIAALEKGKSLDLSPVNQISALIAAEAYAGFNRIDFADCERFMKDTRLFRELYGDSSVPNRQDLQPHIEAIRRKMKERGNWFPSREAYLWALRLEAEFKKNPNRKLSSEEMIRHFNILRRMKTFDPLYARFTR